MTGTRLDTQRDEQVPRCARDDISLNVGVAPNVLAGAVEALLPLLGEERTRSVRLLLARVLGK